MAITQISRYYSNAANIVTIISTDTLNTITADNYLRDENENIITINKGTFDWFPSDLVLISYSGGTGFFVRNATTNTFVSNGGGVSPSLLNYIPVPITADEFRDMHTNPILILPAQGENTVIIVQSSWLEKSFNTIPWAGGGNINFQYGDSGYPASQGINGGTIADTSAAIYPMQNLEDSIFYVPTLFAEEDLVLINETANFTDGDGSFVMHLWYQVIPVTLPTA